MGRGGRGSRLLIDADPAPKLLSNSEYRYTEDLRSKGPSKIEKLASIKDNLNFYKNFFVTLFLYNFCIGYVGISIYENSFLIVLQHPLHRN